MGNSNSSPESSLHRRIEFLLRDESGDLLDTGILSDEEYFRSALSVENVKREFGPNILDQLRTVSTSQLSDPVVTLGDVDKIQFYLVTKKGSPQQEMELLIGNLNNLRDSHFDPKAPTKIICHGYMSNRQVGPGQILKSSYLAHPRYDNINLIMVDWWDLAGFIKPTPIHSLGFWDFLYFPPAKHVRAVGEKTARLIQYLVGEGGASIDNFHLIGHSLGAHAMGWAGRSLVGNLSVPRITGLDPAKPCFEKCIRTLCRVFSSCSPDYVPLCTSDALFVDIIHTNGARWGYYKPLGHVDFYPNGGQTQPGCKAIIGLLGCSHGRAIDLYAASLTAPPDKFMARECSSHEQLPGSCSRVPTIKMGEDCPSNARGIYYLTTTVTFPYYNAYY